MSDCKRIHLLHQKGANECWYILDTETDYIGAIHDGKVSIIHTDDVYQADSMVDLLLQLREEDDTYKWWCVTDWLGNDGVYRHDEYKHFQSIHPMKGYIKEVCEIRVDKNCYLRDWEVSFVSELWYRRNDYSIFKVHDFTEKMDKLVREYVEQLKEQN